MRIIGITGGVGAGKSEILAYIQNNYNSRIVRADEVAHLVKEPGQECYDRLITLLGKEVLNNDKTINKGKMAELIFTNDELLAQVNALIHPAVKKYILDQIEIERNQGKVDFFFIEAALLIEEHYDTVVDEMWYIHADVAVREKRLSQSRHYSDKKIADIMRGQLSEEVFRSHCNVVISNSGDIEDTYKQINNIMGERI